MPLYGFGSNITGQLGLPEDIIFTDKPIEIKEFRNLKILKIACGKMHNLVLCEKNMLFSWGVNDDYALGREGVDNEGVTQVDFNEEIEDICAGASFSAILTKKGRVYVCGTFKSTNGIFGFSINNKFAVGFQLISSVKGIKSISAGQNHILMLHKNGDVYAMGANESFQLGRKHRLRNEKYVLIPQIISSSSNRNENYNFIQLSAGQYHSFALNTNYELFSWGSNCNGQLGNGTLESADLKYKINIKDVKDIQCGYNHSVVLTNSGHVYGCGENKQFQLMNSDKLIYNTFVKLDNKKYDKIRCGGDFTVMVKNNKLYTRGINLECECGLEGVDCARDLVEVDVSGKLRDVQCGGNYTLIHK